MTKAFLLAAGEGKRLRPLTVNIPKCLLPINNIPLLEIWLRNCEKHGISHVLINGHHLAEQVEDYIGKSRRKFNLSITYIYEPRLKGTGGTVRDNFNFVRDEKYFYILHADNLSDIDLTKFRQFHVAKNALLSVALFYTSVPEQCGIVEEINDDGLITSFRERPEKPTSNLASAAMFVASPEIIKDIPLQGNVDFSKEVLPKYVGHMYGYKIEGYNIDIGTPENYAQAQELALQKGIPT